MPTLSSLVRPLVLCVLLGVALGSGAARADSDRTVELSGTPPLRAFIGTHYTFEPTLWTFDAGAVRYEVINLPQWASFDPATGRISGWLAPADEGFTSPITILAVSEYGYSAALPTFAISVEPFANAAAGQVALLDLQESNHRWARVSWELPTTNTDDSPLTDLAGLYIYHGSTPDQMRVVVEIEGASANVVLTNLPSGTNYFAVSAFNSEGAQSITSAPVVKIF